jgi:SAM-dependent methyltransferase
LDLRPNISFAEQTKYLDEALHADGRHEAVAPPLLGSFVRQEMLRRFLRPRAGDRVLDLGCGNGRTLVWNAASDAKLVGVDVSPFIAAEAADRADLVLGDLRRLPFRDGQFTKAWALDVFEHLSPAALDDVLAEIHRVLQDNGCLFVYTHVRKNGWIAGGVRAVNTLARLIERAGLLDLRQERLRKSDHVNPIDTHEELRHVLDRAGLQVERMTYYTPIIGAFVENILARMAEHWLNTRTSMNRHEQAGRKARAAAQARVRTRGATFRLLLGISHVMMLDVALFGRLRSGPFFALIKKTHAATR